MCTPQPTRWHTQVIPIIESNPPSTTPRSAWAPRQPLYSRVDLALATASPEYTTCSCHLGGSFITKHPMGGPPPVGSSRAPTVSPNCSRGEKGGGRGSFSHSEKRFRCLTIITTCTCTCTCTHVHVELMPQPTTHTVAANAIPCCQRGVLTPKAQRRHRCSFAYWPRSYARRPRRRPGTPPWVAKPHTPADVLAVCSLVISASSGSENWLRYACS